MRSRDVSWMLIAASLMFLGMAVGSFISAKNCETKSPFDGIEFYTVEGWGGGNASREVVITEAVPVYTQEEADAIGQLTFDVKACPAAVLKMTAWGTWECARP